jgi:hypothetical protein
MAKPDKPLLSLGARGTIADSLTFQKRGKGYIAREKPIPTDPKSEAQLAQRQIYKDAVSAWHALSPEEKEAWRGVCPGLTAYQCFMRSHLVYAPPPVLFYMGAEAIDRVSYFSPNHTLIGKDNPASVSGILTTAEIWAYSEITGCVVGIFYTTNANSLKCRASVSIGGMQPGSKKIFPGLSLAVIAGDYIGMFSTGGGIERDTQGFAGLWYIFGKYIDPGDEATYGVASGDAISLYGIGEQAA